MRLFYSHYLMLAFSLVFFCCPHVKAASPKPDITWLAIDATPMWINSGKLAGLGYVEGVENLLQQHLPQYNHKRDNIVYMRTRKIMQSRDACFAAAPYQGYSLTAEQKKGIIWSAPTAPFFYQGIITTTEYAPKFKRHTVDGFVNLPDLMADTKIRPHG